MKSFLILVLIGALYEMGCAKSNQTPDSQIIEIPDTTAANALLKGSFYDGPHGHVKGEAKVYASGEKLYLELRHFTTSSGPDLHVYLSRESEPIHFIELGNLKATQGDQVYSIPGNPDFSVYKYALIHCQQFNHVFGIA